MLVELAVRNLGVVESTSVVLGPGLTALTGETGAGKTLLVQAVALLLGGRADGSVVGAAGDEAEVEGRFVVDGAETTLRRAVPRDGRSRAYVDGRMATATELAGRGAALVDLHGQHAHQSLLTASEQRAALDRAAGVDLAPLQAAGARVAELERALDALGGDERARARELELLAHQIGEIEAASLTGADEDDRLAAQEALLADATAHRLAAAEAHDALQGDDGVVERLGGVQHRLRDRSPFAGLVDRLDGVLAELDDVASEVRALGEGIEDDPAALEAVRQRRQLLRELGRKYGAGAGEVLAFAEEARARRDELADAGRRAAELDGELAAARAERDRAAAAVGAARRAGAAPLAEAVQDRFAALAMPRAALRVRVGDDDPGDDVTFAFSANDAAADLALRKVASGGELARVMLALRLVLTEGPPSMVFDEVDAGVGGEAARAVGEALAGVARHHQVLVVTHLPQVAALADVQIVVRKAERAGRVSSAATPVAGAERVAELARMLAGDAGSAAARRHAEELLRGRRPERVAR